MKTLFITIETGFQARDLLRSEFFERLKKKDGLRVILLVPERKLDYYRNNYQSGNVTVEPVPEKKAKTKLETLAYFFGKSSISSATIKIHHHRYLAADKNSSFIKKLAVFSGKRLFWYLGKLRLWREFVRWLFRLSASGRHYDEIFAKYQPDLIYAVNLLRFDEFRMIKRAKEKGIKTISYILSWDNLNSKLFVFFKSDEYIVTTDFVKEECLAMADVGPEDVAVVGVIKYDRYFKKEAVVSKEEFFKKIGCSMDKKLILYGLSSRNTSPNYNDVIEDMHDLSASGQIELPHQFMIRTYPKYALSEELIGKIKDWGMIYNQPSEFWGGEENWEIKREDDDFFTNLFYHSDLIITNYCTIVIEASIFDKPVININYDGHQKKKYLFSINRIRDYTHYRQIVASGGERAANSKDELLQLINSYLKNPRQDAEGRKRIVAEQCKYSDGQTGERMYNYIVKNL